jgi:hypothetical protein
LSHRLGLVEPDGAGVLPPDTLFGGHGPFTSRRIFATSSRLCAASTKAGERRASA